MYLHSSIFLATQLYMKKFENAFLNTQRFCKLEIDECTYVKLLSAVVSMYRSLFFDWESLGINTFHDPNCFYICSVLTLNVYWQTESLEPSSMVLLLQSKINKEWTENSDTFQIKFQNFLDKPQKKFEKWRDFFRMIPTKMVRKLSLHFWDCFNRVF